MKKNKVLLFIIIIFGLVMIIFNTVNLTASYYAKQGERYNEQLESLKAIDCYEKASWLDNKNAEFYAVLADLYNRVANNSKTAEQMAEWRSKALKAGEYAVMYNPNYPYYNYILTQIYFDSGNSIKAYEQVQKLTDVQPMKSKNYELLSRAYVEAGLQYLRDKNVSKAKELILKASVIEKQENVKPSPTIYFYEGKALLLLGDFKHAEELLIKARADSLTLKMDSDRLLYIINEETNRKAENKKYKYVLWMGMVEKTPDYLEVKSILSKKLLQ